MRKISNIWISPAEAVLYIALILAVIGLVNVFSASFVVALHLFQDSYFFLKRQVGSLGLAVIVMVITASVRYTMYQKLAPYLLIITIITLLGVLFNGVDANGARRWLNLGVKFQPSEIAKIAAILVTAGYLGPRVDRKQRVTLLSMPLFMVLIMGGLVLKQPDMGTAVVIVAPCLLLYMLIGISRQEKVGLCVLGSISILLAVYLSAYRAERIWAWLDPWAYQQSNGYQAVQSLLAIGSGGIWGNGLGMGSSKFHYLPEAHTDFAFALFSQEAGFFGALLILIMFLSLGWYGVKITISAQDGFGTIVAGGITILIVGQALINIAMVSGLLPVTGIPLPFVSYGGTSLVINMAAIGILISVGRSAGAGNKSKKAEQPEAKRKLRLVKKTGPDKKKA